MQVPGVAGVTSTQILPLMGEVDHAEVRRENAPASAMLDVYSIGGRALLHHFGRSHSARPRF